MKKIVTVILTVAAVSIAAFVTCNSFDSAQLPQVKDLLSLQPQATEQELKGFQYLLALLVPPDKDPAVVGADVYNRLTKLTDHDSFEKAQEYLAQLQGVEVTSADFECAQHFCDDKALTAERGKDKEFLARFGFLLKRYKTLISFGGFANGLRPNILWSTSRILAFFTLSKIQYLDWSRRLAKGEYGPVLNEMRTAARFTKSPLRHISSSLEMTVAAILIKYNRDYLTAAAKRYPAIAKICDKNCLADFTIDKSFDELLPNQFAFELQSIDGFLRRPFDDEAVGNVVTEMPYKGFFKLLASSHFSYSLEIQRNRTLNNLYIDMTNAATAPCVKAYTACPKQNLSLPLYKLFINPAGRVLSLIFSAGPSRYRDLNRNLSIDRAPLTL